jgi:hypothetical protein
MGKINPDPWLKPLKLFAGSAGALACLKHRLELKAK